MTETQSGLIPAHAVRRIAEPVLLGCAAESGDAMVVIPLLENGTVVGLEVRCRCGASVVVECVYEEKP